MDYELMLKEGVAQTVDMFVKIWEQNPKLRVGIIAFFISSFIVLIARKIIQEYFVITGESKRKARKKAGLIMDVISLIDSLKKK